MTEAAAAPRNLSGGAWLIADFSLNIWALSIVKAMGLDYPAVQLVFLRALVGLALMLPWIWRQRRAFGLTADPGLHLLRVVLSSVTLVSSFFAIARVPIALFTAINFTRPLMLMVMAALILRERIPGRRWIAALVGLAGVLVAVEPWGPVPSGPGLAALAVTVTTGTGAVIVTRRLAATPTLVLMGFYTGGLALVTAPFAALSWQPVAGGEWLPLLAIGVFAQSGQFCFLQAHKRAEAAYLAVLGYGSLVIASAVGYLVFGEALTLLFVLGAALIVAAALWSGLTARPGSRPVRPVQGPR
ncbi:EamA family transporter [Rhodobacteraceae bacterium 2CG4]|uniref:EamA family transporter n=1 Tax=Halovulum marinum TaxID=2662447 RepID=A0A6L5YXX0_9RHOB|nr:DMT family transporter [Halovulum marinum]MSU88839.1 EamA family transporter [Halovulum marinum]